MLKRNILSLINIIPIIAYGIYLFFISTLAGVMFITVVLWSTILNLMIQRAETVEMMNKIKENK